MSKPTFTWTPDLGAQQSITPSVTQTKFGDGYELRVARGINTQPRMWNVTFSKEPNEAAAILDFFEARAGVEAFSWTDPFNKTGTYVCRQWNSGQALFGVYSITATFEQVFEY